MSTQRLTRRSVFLTAIFTIIVFLAASPAITAKKPLSTPPEKTLNLLDEDDLEFLARTKVIKKCVDPHWMPLEGINPSHQHVGIIADILKTVEKEIGISFILVPTESWQESMEKLKSGECDIVTSDAAGGEIADSYLKTKPFLNHRNVYITRSDSPLQLNFLAIADKPIGIPKGYPTISLIKEYYGDVNIVEVDDVDEGLLKVSQGELYAFTDLLPVCSYSIQRQGLTNLKVAGHLEFSLPTVMDVRSDMPQLVKILNKIFSTITPAEFNKFHSQWIDVKYDMKFDWRASIKYFVVAVLFLLLVIYWIRKLRNLNRMLDSANKELMLLNETDALTKLKNRNFITYQLPGLISIANRNKLSLGIAMLDIDHFKRLNDNYGHAVGDKYLVIFSEKICSIFRRESDWGIRYGGEEFVLICIGVSAKTFIEKLEEFRHEIEKAGQALDLGKDASFTVSIGYTFHPVTPERWDECLVAEADDKLYYAKKNGRNQIVG